MVTEICSDNGMEWKGEVMVRLRSYFLDQHFRAH